MDLELVAGVSAVALIMSLVQLAKQAQLLPSRWAGLAAVGLALGLSAAGLWSTGKNVYRG